MVKLIGPQHKEWQRETILEQIRQAEYKALPSRLDSAFVIDDEAEAKYYVGKASPTAVLYAVTLVDEKAATHVADWKGTGPYDHPTEWARRYWRGDIMPHPETHLSLRERLTLSRLRIDARI
jgi:hypothetical protein